MALKTYEVLVGEDLLSDDLHWVKFTVNITKVGDIMLAAFESGLEVLVREKKGED